MVGQGDVVRLTARAFGPGDLRSWARVQHLRHPYRKVTSSPDAFDVWWRRIAAVTDLELPEAPLVALEELPPVDAALVARFVACAYELAVSRFMAEPARMKLDLGPNRGLEVEWADKETARSANVLIRQCNTTGDEASFYRVYKVVERTLHASGVPVTPLRPWRAAHALLEQASTEALLAKRAILEAGASEVRREELPGGDRNPRQLVTEYLYGDLIHWGPKYRDGHEREQTIPVLAQLRHYAFLEASKQLGHFYMLFAYALLREAALQRRPSVWDSTR